MKTFKITTKNREKTVKKFVSIAAIAFLFTTTMAAPLAPIASVKAETINRDNNVVRHYVIGSDYKLSEITEYASNQISTENTGAFKEISAGTQTVVDIKTLELQGFVVHEDNKNIPPVVEYGGAVKPVLKPSIVTQTQLAQVIAPQVHELGVHYSVDQIRQLLILGLQNGTIEIGSNMNLITIIQQIVNQLNAGQTQITINVGNCGGQKGPSIVVKGDESDLIIQHQQPTKPVILEQPPVRQNQQINTQNNNNVNHVVITGENGPISTTNGGAVKPVVGQGQETITNTNTNVNTNTNTNTRPPVKIGGQGGTNTNVEQVITGQQGPTSTTNTGAFKPVTGQGQETITNTNTNTNTNTVITAQLLSNTDQLITLLANQAIHNGLHLDINLIRLYIFTSINAGTINILPGMNISDIVNQIVSQLSSGQVNININVYNCCNLCSSSNQGQVVHNQNSGQLLGYFGLTSNHSTFEQFMNTFVHHNTNTQHHNGNNANHHNTNTQHHDENHDNHHNTNTQHHNGNGGHHNGGHC